MAFMNFAIPGLLIGSSAQPWSSFLACLDAYLVSGRGAVLLDCGALSLNALWLLIDSGHALEQPLAISEQPVSAIAKDVADVQRHEEAFEAAAMWCRGCREASPIYIGLPT